MRHAKMPLLIYPSDLLTGTLPGEPLSRSERAMILIVA